MKKVLLSLGSALLLAVGANAQTGYGIKAGVTLPSYSYGSSDDLSDTKSALNFYITGYLNANINQNFAIQPGVSLQGKGAKFAEARVGGTTYELTQNTMWIEVPVNFVGKLPVGAAELQLGAGPYVGFGVSGKNKFNTIGNGDGSSTTLNEFKFGKDEHLKAVDFGANIMAGVKLPGGFLINANYGLGLTNIAGDKSLTNDIKNRVLSFGVGFEF
ncbi:outer membrane beta-barrel protein [Sphingobacterium composti Ten et al. 2007 non Yoo et al. 2007]|uniref:outer membrane beta-barrel protein n=1 Tax=Sphingobacterium composti TaxID=363260 RepID=UPI00135B05E7|nr:outer membrane beta-barrel protein [Sphingobacterium composti Ten et al. 2007 non Yoo et al. 2007]